MGHTSLPTSLLHTHAKDHCQCDIERLRHLECTVVSNTTTFNTFNIENLFEKFWFTKG